MTDRHGRASAIRLTGLSAYGLVFTGLFLMMVSVAGGEVWHWPVWFTTFVRDVGLLLAAVMGGTILHEKLLRDEMVTLVVDQLDEELRRRIPSSLDSAKLTATEVHRLFTEHPPRETGIRLLSDVRRNFSGYYSWVNVQKPQELFFAGRSVLHRIDADIRSRTSTCAEDIIFRRLKEGSKIKVLFLDPRIDILERLAKEEGQTLKSLLGDLAISLGICRRLFDLLARRAEELRPGSELTIRVYDRVPYFAFHRQDDDAIVGFYFLSSKGSSSAAYQLLDEETKQVFGDHFVRILSESADQTLVEFDGARGRPSFNEDLFASLRGCLAAHLGEADANELLERHPTRVATGENTLDSTAMRGNVQADLGQ